jgi:hypothetical protein
MIAVQFCRAEHSVARVLPGRGQGDRRRRVRAIRYLPYPSHIRELSRTSACSPIGRLVGHTTDGLAHKMAGLTARPPHSAKGGPQGHRRRRLAEMRYLPTDAEREQAKEDLVWLLTALHVFAGDMSRRYPDARAVQLRSRGRGSTAGKPSAGQRG